MSESMEVEIFRGWERVYGDDGSLTLHNDELHSTVRFTPASLRAIVVGAIHGRAGKRDHQGGSDGILIICQACSGEGILFDPDENPEPMQVPEAPQEPTE